MSKNRDRQRQNRRIKQELNSLDRKNASKINDPTAYQAAKNIIIEKLRKGKEQ